MTDHPKHTVNRRQFLSAALAAAAAGLTRRAWSQTRDAARATRGDIARLALLSDTHTPANPDNRCRGFYPYRNLVEAVGRIADDLPDAMLVAGDVARLTGKTADYATFKELIAPIAATRPVHLTLGNHDHRGRFVQALRDFTGDTERLEDRHVVAVYAGPVRLILLDSLMWVNMSPGQLGRLQRVWLQQYLQRCDETPTILCFHHTIRCGANDLMDAGALLDIVRPVAKVKALIFGHSHICNFDTIDGIHLVNLPAIGYNQSDSQPVGWMDARVTRKGAELTVRAIGGERRLDGYVRRLTWRT